MLRRFAEEVEARAEALSATNTRENGSPVAETGGAAANAAGILRYFAGLAGHLEREDVRPFPNGSGESVVRREPLGVCALIAPWNFPINLVMIKLAPALLAGNTVVIKPASPTPLSIRHIVEAAQAAGVPAGVVNLVTGNGRTGDAMVRHPLIDKVAFTGSTEVGRRIAAACGELLRPVTLELGGKSAAILLDDVDLDAFAQVFLRSCMRNSGQTCYISTRILAPARATGRSWIASRNWSPRPRKAIPSIPPPCSAPSRIARSTSRCWSIWPPPARKGRASPPAAIRCPARASSSRRRCSPM